MIIKDEPEQDAELFVTKVQPERAPSPEFIDDDRELKFNDYQQKIEDGISRANTDINNQINEVRKLRNFV